MENEPGLGKYVFSAKACSAIHQRAKAKGLALLLVPGENLRLGLGPAVCMAGLGRATHLRRTHPSRRPVLPARAGRDGVPRSRVWMSAVLIAICWWKGEPPRWRWGAEKPQD